MKKIDILILSVMTCLFLNAQETPISKVVNMTVPKGAIKLNKEEVKSYADREFGNSEITSVNTQNLYSINELLMAFWDLNVSEGNKKSLEAIKSEALELYKLDKNIIVDDASIKEANNNKILVISYKNKDANYYRFISEYRNNQAISGLIQFKASDKNQSKAILKEILSSIKFK
jgi:hypothetical protein